MIKNGLNHTLKGRWFVWKRTYINDMIFFPTASIADGGSLKPSRSHRLRRRFETKWEPSLKVAVRTQMGTIAEGRGPKPSKVHRLGCGSKPRRDHRSGSGSKPSGRAR